MRTQFISTFSLLALCAALIGCEKKEVSATSSSPEKTQPAKTTSPEAASAFVEAAFQGKTLDVKTALEDGIPANQNNPEGFCALMAASFNGHVETMQLLLDSGADVNQTNKQGVTPLMAACGPYPQAVRLLLENGAEVNAKDGIESFTALMYAATEGLSPIVDILLEHGADPTMKDVDGDTAATFASNSGHRALGEKLQSLIDAKKK